MAETGGTMAELRRRHIAQPRPAPNEHQPYCVACGEDWPCYTVWLLDVADAASDALWSLRNNPQDVGKALAKERLSEALDALDTREAAAT